MADVRLKKEIMEFLDEVCESGDDFKIVHGRREYNSAEIKQHLATGSTLGRKLYEKVETLYYARQYCRQRNMQTAAMRGQSGSFRDN